MKTLFIALFIIITTQYVFAQDANHTIEIHLNLMEKNNPQGIKELALGVSVINHSDRDVYIPNFRVFSTYSGVHFYQKEDSIWREISVAEHKYVRTMLPTQMANGTTAHLDEPVFYDDENSFTKQYRNRTNQLFSHQDSIMKSYYNTVSNPHDVSTLILYQQEPLFLKAHEKIDNFLVLSLDYLLTKKMEYKISFNTEARDTLNYYREPRVYSKQKKQYEELHYPEQIYGYQLFYPKGIISNTIYYTNDKAIIRNK